MTTTKVLVVQPDSTATIRQLPRGAAAWQEVVGGWIESVTLDDNVRVMLNEEGKLLELAPNRVADALVRAFMEITGRALRPGDYISGPAIFYGTPVAGEPTDVPDVVIELVRRAGIEIREEEP